MTSLLRRTRLTGLGLVLALGLTVLPGVVAPFLSYDLANWLPVPAEVLAHHGGPHDGCC